MTKPLPIAIVRVAPYDYYLILGVARGKIEIDDGLLLQPWTEFHMLCRHLHVVVSETLTRK